jgi:hypothetical protein
MSTYPHPVYPEQRIREVDAANAYLLLDHARSTMLENEAPSAAIARGLGGFSFADNEAALAVAESFLFAAERALPQYPPKVLVRAACALIQTVRS